MPLPPRASTPLARTTATLALAACALAHAGPSVYPEGTTRLDPARAWPSYVLFTGGDEKARVLDLDGHTVHTWRDVGPLAPDGLAQQHHDWARLPNGHTLVLANLRHAVPGFSEPEVLDDVAYEVDRDGAIVWRWVASDHLAEFGFSPAALAPIRASGNADFLHVNDLKPLGHNRWFEAGDTRFAPDNLILDSRNANANVIAIVDRHGGHGNLLVFDNQGEAGYPPVELPTTGGSRVLEIDPVARRIVWQYTAEDSGQPPWAFRSTHISAARRLPNGNTFIDEGQSGRLFQATRDGDIVWEYVNGYPHVGKDPVDGKVTVNHQLYRAQPVPLDWAPAGRAGRARQMPGAGHSPSDAARPLDMTVRLAGPCRSSSPTATIACLVVLALATTGCSSLLDQGAATTAGIVGAAGAATVTKNAAVSAGIGLGVLAAAQTGVKAIERHYHGHEQDNIAGVAGGLAVGQVAPWHSEHAIQLEPDEAGRVTVSRVISATGLDCKEIVFSVDHVKDAKTLSAFYVATICKDSVKWRWASAEPATARWGSLQ